MGTQLFRFLVPLKIDSPPTHTCPKILTRNNNNSSNRCCCTRSSGGSRWYHSNPDKTIPSVRFNFSPEDEFLADDEDDGAFGFKNAANNTDNRRNWWSGDNFPDDDDDYDEDDEFGVLEDSIGGIAWITKVLKAFGWMLPAIVISMLVGTGPNTFLMALALPLAQSTMSVVADTLWGRRNGNSKYKPRTKRRPSRRAASNVGTSKEKDQSTAYEDSAKKGDKTSTNFGGWDELDKQGRMDQVPFMAQSQKPNEESRPKGKLSRTLRRRDKPLMLRLLIAIFPFIGSWTRLL